MTPAVRIAIAGAGGKMGQALIEAVLARFRQRARCRLRRRAERCRRAAMPASGSDVRPA